MVIKVNAIDTIGLVMMLKWKVEIPIITGLATTAAFNDFNSEIPNFSDLVN